MQQYRASLQPLIGGLRVRVHVEPLSTPEGATRSFASRSTKPPHRWLPVPIASPAPRDTPLPGWRDLDAYKWQTGIMEPGNPNSVRITGCSALVRAVRKALLAPPDGRPLPQSYWRHALHLGGRTAKYLRPDEACELLEAYADARVQWEGDPKARKGLERFALHTSEELGSFSPPQMGQAVWALARLDHHSENLMQTLSRAVENAVQHKWTKLDNATVCTLLAAYKRFGILDEPALESLSRLICRRLVREPMEPSQTASVVVAYAELRMRDVGLFNATTLALTRPRAVGALKWGEMADVAYSYASLRLHSDSLFSEIWKRVAESAGVKEEDVQTDDKVSTNLVDIVTDLREQLDERVPEEPRLRMPVRSVARLLEAQVQLDRLSRQDLAPLLPYLAHPASRFPARPAMLLAAALSRGGHVQPWLWRWTATAFADDGLPPRSLLALLEALRAHLARLAPLLNSYANSGRGRQRWRKQTGETVLDSRMRLKQHLDGVAGNCIKLMGNICYRCPAMSDAELQIAAVIVGKLIGQYTLLEDFLSRSSDDGKSAFGGRSNEALARTARRFAAEMTRRKLGILQADVPEQSRNEVLRLAQLSGVAVTEVEEDAQQLNSDSIYHVPIDVPSLEMGAAVAPPAP